MIIPMWHYNVHYKFITMEFQCKKFHNSAQFALAGVRSFDHVCIVSHGNLGKKVQTNSPRISIFTPRWAEGPMVSS
jgi:hypothetical protein